MKDFDEFLKKRLLEKNSFIQERIGQLALDLRQLILAANSDYKSFSAFCSRHSGSCLSRQVNRYDFEKIRFLMHPDEKLKIFAKLLLAAQFDDETAQSLGEKPRYFRRAWSSFINSRVR